MISLAQPFFQLQIVFDDAVVHNDNAAGAITMRMSIFLGRPAVSRPARVPDAICAIEWGQSYSFFEISQFAFGAANLKIAVFVHDRDAG